MTVTPSKQLAFVHSDGTRFAVGDFSPVLSVFSYRESHFADVI